MKHLKDFNINENKEAKEKKSGYDVKQRFIDLVEERIDDLKREIRFTKQGHDFYEKTQEKIDELTDLLTDMKNIS